MTEYPKPTKRQLRRILRYLRSEKHFARNTRDLVRFLADWFGLVTSLVGCEVGVQRGRTTEALLEFFPKLLLVAVDQWKEYAPDILHSTQTEHDSYYKEMIERTKKFRDRLTIQKGDSALSARFFDDDTFDFVYIDADHHYPNVVADCEAWWPKVKKGGLLCGDDYCGDNAPDWKKKHNRDLGFGVDQAVNEFVEARNLTLQFGGKNLFYVQKT